MTHMNQRPITLFLDISLSPRHVLYKFEKHVDDRAVASMISSILLRENPRMLDRSIDDMAADR